MAAYGGVFSHLISKIPKKYVLHQITMSDLMSHPNLQNLQIPRVCFAIDQLTLAQLEKMRDIYTVLITFDNYDVSGLFSEVFLEYYLKTFSNLLECIFNRDPRGPSVARLWANGLFNTFFGLIDNITRAGSNPNGNSSSFYSRFCAQSLRHAFAIRNLGENIVITCEDAEITANRKKFLKIVHSLCEFFLKNIYRENTIILPQW